MAFSVERKILGLWVKLSGVGFVSCPFLPPGGHASVRRHLFRPMMQQCKTLHVHVIKVGGQTFPGSFGFILTIHDFGVGGGTDGEMYCEMQGI